MSASTETPRPATHCDRCGANLHGQDDRNATGVARPRLFATIDTTVTPNTTEWICEDCMLREAWRKS